MAAAKVDRASPRCRPSTPPPSGAAAKIKENWGDDGLKHSGLEVFVHGFNKFLKGLVEILGYIGMALAVLAFLLPGVGALALAGLIVGVVSLVASIVLAAQGEASWMGVILGVVGVAAAGVGLVVAKSIRASSRRLAEGRGRPRSARGGSRAIVHRARGRPIIIQATGRSQKISIMITDDQAARLGRSDRFAPIKTWSLSGAPRPRRAQGALASSASGVANFTSSSPGSTSLGSGRHGWSGLDQRPLGAAVAPMSFPGEDRRRGWTALDRLRVQPLTT